MFCKKCGYQNSMDARFCSKCGKKLHSKKETKKKMLVIVSVCLLIVAFVLGNGISNRSVPRDDIVQVLPMEDGSVAVLYTDGTVRVAGNAYFSQEVSDWSGVTQLYYDHYSVFDGRPILAGVTENQGVLTTEEDFPSPHLSNADELHFLASGIVCVSKNGYAEPYGDVEYIAELLELDNIKDMFYSYLSDAWYVLKRNGDVYIISEYADPFKVYWDDVKEIRDSGHAVYVIKNDGTVDGEMEDTYSGLTGAVKIVHYNDWVFGISADGRLLTHNGGNIYINTGDMMVDVPGTPYYGEEVDISQFDQVADILAFGGLILLNEDGTVDAISYEPEWDLSDWRHIEKIYGCDSLERDYTALYGIRKDGTVIRNRYDWIQGTQSVTKNYRKWKLQEIYGGEGGVIGLTVDGKLVGDGIYENVDFSVFDQ